MVNNMLPRTCRDCGKVFIGGPRAWYCHDCRKERAREANKRAKQKKKTAEYIPVGSIIQCELCGKEIIKRGGKHKYCNKCAEKHLKEIDNAQSLEWKKNNPEKIRKSKKKYNESRKKTSPESISDTPPVK